jgi:hypothetical protein
MMPRLAFAAALFAASAGALLAGLVPTVLRTGRLDPLDWLLPGLAALLAILWLQLGRGGSWRVQVTWASLALPSVLFVLIAGMRPPFAPLLGLMLLLALSAGLIVALDRRRPLARSLALLLWIALLGSGRWVAQSGATIVRAASAQEIGLMSALPLAGVRSTGPALLDNFAVHGPLATALAPDFRMRPLDRIDSARLAGLRTLLLAQPRQLAPDELVALDRWVREGGLAVILADPLLRWSDPRPFGDPLRAPLTSLLDPLLAHWGLALAPADLAGAGLAKPRLVGSGMLLQLAGASSFTRAQASVCRLADAGLIARCPLGRGEARLVADADWLNDAQWTADPAQPHRVAGWTSDAIPMLTHLLRRNGQAPLPAWTWLRDGEQLVSGLRAALLLAGLIALGGALVQPIPRSTQERGVQKARNGAVTADVEPDSSG